MRNLRRPLLVLVLFLATFTFFGASPRTANAATTFCYTWPGTYITCRICEFYGPNGEYLGFISTCWERDY